MVVGGVAPGVVVRKGRLNACNRRGERAWLHIETSTEMLCIGISVHFFRFQNLIKKCIVISEHFSQVTIPAARATLLRSATDIAWAPTRHPWPRGSPHLEIIGCVARRRPGARTDHLQLAAVLLRGAVLQRGRALRPGLGEQLDERLPRAERREFHPAL